MAKNAYIDRLFKVSNYLETVIVQTFGTIKEILLD